MKLDAPDLANETVRLEPFGEAHRTVMDESGAVESMWAWLPIIPSGTSFNGYFDHVLAQKQSGELIPFAIYRQSDNAFAGVCAYLNPSRTHRRVQIGMVWHPKSMRGTAIAPATQQLMIKRALAARVLRVEWHIVASNERAIGSIVRFGAVKEGVLRNYIRRADGQWANIAILSMLAPEARAAVKLIGDRVAAMTVAG